MQHPPPVRASAWSANRVRLLRLAAAVWLGCGIVQVAQSYVLARAAGRLWSLGDALLAGMPWWLSWLALTPVIAWVAERYPFAEQRLWRSLVRHAMAAVVIACVHLTVTGAVYWWSTGRSSGVATSLGNQVQRWFGSFFLESLVTYAGVAGVLIAIDFARARRDEAVLRSRLEAHAARLEASEHRARLDALAMELNPHFLFNTLSAVSGLIAQRRNAEAREVIQRLGGLLRQSLGGGNGSDHTVEREVELLEDYLFIQRVRFSDRLRITLDVADSVRDCGIPIMLLQPLVENAVRHGVEPREGPVALRITMDETQDGLRIVVADSGPGFDFGAAGTLQREGIGLANTRERLRRLFGDRGTLELRNGTAGGAEAVVSIPASRNGNHA